MFAEKLPKMKRSPSEVNGFFGDELNKFEYRIFILIKRANLPL